MKRYLLSIFNLLLIIVLFVYAHELRVYTDSKHAAAVYAITQLNGVILEQDKKLQEQNKQIEQYKAYVENVGRCIVEGVW